MGSWEKRSQVSPAVREEPVRLFLVHLARAGPPAVAPGARTTSRVHGTDPRNRQGQGRVFGRSLPSLCAPSEHSPAPVLPGHEVEVGLIGRWPPWVALVVDRQTAPRTGLGF